MVILFLGMCVSADAQPPDRPNIIFILADDLGWSNLSIPMDPDNAASVSDFHETPNLNKLAQQGMRFSRGYASASICSPSRRSILLGLTPARLGDESFAQKYDPRLTQHPTIPRVLKAIDARYRTAHYGKWDMRGGFHPEDAGYDESDGNTGNRHGNMLDGDDDKWTAHFMHDDPKQVFTLAHRAINFMQREVKAGNPFYLQISHYATHVDMQTQPDTYARFKAKPGGEKHAEPGLAGMLYDLDRSIGMVLEIVDQLGVRDNTYIFFMADNGAPEFIPPVKNRLDHPATFKARMRNFPLRGGKWTLYEGGIRVPFIVAGPGVRANSHCATPVVGWDLLPTFSELAGSLTTTEDGGSFASLLKNGGDGKVKRHAGELVFHRYNKAYPHSALIDGDFKLLKFWKSGKVELYNLRDDIGEEKDIAREHPEKAKALATKLARYLGRVNPELTTSTY